MGKWIEVFVTHIGRSEPEFTCACAQAFTPEEAPVESDIEHLHLRAKYLEHCPTCFHHIGAGQIPTCQAGAGPR